jgi:hypothetical protein
MLYHFTLIAARFIQNKRILFCPISTTEIKEYENKNTIVSKESLKIPKGGNQNP